jgi:hypothetical protein
MTSENTTDKPFRIEKRLVYEAYKAVKSKGGAAGVDGQTIEQFEANLGRNLYRIWNRMSSGTYFPPPVLAVSRGGRLRRDSVSVPLSGSSAGSVHPVPLLGSHAGRALARPE